MDAAASFLHRHERHAIAKRRKGEPVRAVAPVMVRSAPGLLAITPTRVLLAQRGRLRTTVQQWRRRDVAGLRFDNVRYGCLVLSLRNGSALRFEFMARDDAKAVEAAVIPARPPVDPVRAALPPVAFQTVRAPKAGMPRAKGMPATLARPAPDPLAHRGSIQHQAKLRQMHAKGVMTKAELDWALGA